MTEIDYGRLNALESVLGGRAAINAMFEAHQTFSGGSGSPPADEFALWARNGALDSTSGTINFVDDQVVVDPHSIIVVDATSDWVANWGNPTAQVTESGLYTMVTRYGLTTHLVTDDHVNIRAGARLLTSGGSAVPNGIIPLYEWFLPPTNDAIEVEQIWTVYLPAGLHIDLIINCLGTAGGAPLNPAHLAGSFSIQRVG